MKLIDGALLLLFAAGVVTDVAAQQGAQTQGVTVVSADNPPLWGTNIRLVRELRIGVVDGAEEYMFSGADRVSGRGDARQRSHLRAGCGYVDRA